MSTSERIPVLLDTDIGSDIDDALALAYLLRQPQCELVGVTTVSGNVAQRSACVRAICESAGRPEVPVHDGSSEVLLFGPGQPNVPQYEVIAARVAAQPRPHDAVDFMRSTIRSRPGEITLLSIGPMTNVALLFALDPEIPSLLKAFVSMAGYFTPEGAAKAEWNVKVDPVAAAVAYARAPHGHINVGLEVTQQCGLPMEDMRRRLTTPPLDVAAQMAEVWFRASDRAVFHDPLAAALIFEPGLCSYRDGVVEVVLADRADAVCASTRLVEADRGRHRVACTVDPAAFFTEFFGVFEG